MEHAVDAATLRSRIKDIGFWYHRIELPGGVITPGLHPLHAPLYRIPEDLTGLRVLDVGAWDGYWTFEALKRGAKEAVAIDDFSDYLGRLNEAQRQAWRSFDLCRGALGYSEDRCRRAELSIYDLTESHFGRFDIVFFFGTLYHLRHPLLGLDRAGAVCDREIYVESAICDDYSPYRGGMGKGYPGKQMICEFYPGTEYSGNATNWWAPTLQCLGGLVQAAGFKSVETWKFTPSPKMLAHCRGYAKGVKA
jgi:tRNA (mo5U34)-methyltransferase